MVGSGSDYRFQSRQLLWSLEGSIAHLTLAPILTSRLTPLSKILTCLPQEVLGALKFGALLCHRRGTGLRTPGLEFVINSLVLNLLEFLWLSR